MFGFPLVQPLSFKPLLSSLSPSYLSSLVHAAACITRCLGSSLLVSNRFAVDSLASTSTSTDREKLFARQLGHYESLRVKGDEEETSSWLSLYLEMKPTQEKKMKKGKRMPCTEKRNEESALN